MAIKTMAHNSNSGQWSEGWHELTISKAEYGNWNDKRYLDLWFEGYPDTFNTRIFEAVNKETHEEFSISNVFKLANAGILDKITSPNGKEAIQYDDESSGLIGKKVNGFFYKQFKDDKEFIKVSSRLAPVIQEGDIMSYTKANVDYWKGSAEKHFREYLNKTPEKSDTEEVTVEDIPF